MPVKPSELQLDGTLFDLFRLLDFFIELSILSKWPPFLAISFSYLLILLLSRQKSYVPLPIGIASPPTKQIFFKATSSPPHCHIIYYSTFSLLDKILLADTSNPVLTSTVNTDNTKTATRKTYITTYASAAPFILLKSSKYTNSISSVAATTK